MNPVDSKTLNFSKFPLVSQLFARSGHTLVRTFATFALSLLSALPAWSFGDIPAGPVHVIEYYNSLTGHYFMTPGQAEMADIAAGSAGSGWAPTGWSFDAYAGPALPGTYCLFGDCGARVFRFYSAFSNSHFFTADPAEAQGLEDNPASEWKLEPDLFMIPVPANGQCAAWQVPVYRLYNNRFAFHDSNHRFVTDAGERAKMVAKGWSDEGVRFCALAAGQVPIKSYAITNIPPAKILPSPVCEDESLNRGPCMAVNNLAAPSTPFVATMGSKMPADFFNRTGLDSSQDFVKSAQSGSPSVLAGDVFVQLSGTTLGIHVDTQSRGPSLYSSVNPLYQFHSTATPGTFDDRFFPWTGYESDTELKVSFTLNVKTINVSGSGSAAYGHPTIEFIDQRSGHHLYFTVLTYDDRPITDTDYLAPDVGTGKVIVGTTFRASSPYGRSFGLPTLHTPPGFVSTNFWGYGGYFEFRMDRDEFQHVVDAARTVDSALSSAPADYLVDNFHFNNEVYGDGEIGLNLDSYTLDLLRR
jgi:hypothetical protein